MNGTRTPVRVLLGGIAVVVAALAVTGCRSISFPTAYLSVNRVPAPLADGMSLPATAGAGSASAAASAKPVPLTDEPLVLPENSTVTLDLTGSWLTWTPFFYRVGADGKTKKTTLASQWLCPAGTSAYFGGTFDSKKWQLLTNSNQILTGLTDGDRIQDAWRAKPFVYSAKCANAYDGKTLTITTPSVMAGAENSTEVYLFVRTGSSDLRPPSRIIYADRSSGEVEESGAIGATTWFLVKLTPKDAPAAAASASTAPTARLIARSTPVLLGGGAFTESRTLWREVDARLSTDPAGGALTYSWDLNGDGVYGDASEAANPATTLPAGVAIVPDSALLPVAGTGELTVGVRVSNAAGQTSTATVALRPLRDSSYNAIYRSFFTLDTAAPAVGGTVTLTLSTEASLGARACVDADADGTYETTVTLPYRTGPAVSTATSTTTALAAGPHEVRVLFLGRHDPSTCTDPTIGGSLSLVYRQVYTSTMARSLGITGSSAVRSGDRAAADPGARAGDYAAATRMTMLDGELLREPAKAAKGMRLDGSVFGGRYRWAVPARGNGKARPAALAAFARGPYAALASQMMLVGGAANQVGFGSGYMLLRGVDEGDLLCLQITSPGPVQRTLILGGTGAGATLRGSLSGSSLKIPFDALGLVGVTGSGKSAKPEFGQVEAFSNTARLTASTGSARALPKACRGLVRHLPATDDDGSSTPSVVTG